MVEKILFPKTGPNTTKTRSLAGKTILITGASYGIGNALSIQLSKLGAKLILIARTEEKLIELKADCLKNGAQSCEFFICDLYDLEQTKLLAAKLNDELINLDVFISNAGKSIKRSFDDSKYRWKDIHRTNMLNFQSPVYLIQNLYDKLRINGGKVVNVSTLNILLPPTPHWAAYNASKTGFDRWCRSNKAEWKQNGVHLKTAYFPLVDTRMSRANKDYDKTPKMSPEQAASRIIQLLCTRKQSYRPWWSYFLVFLYPFKNTWAKAVLKKYQK